MSILEQIFDSLKEQSFFTGINFALSELPLNTPSATILSLQGGASRNLYIGGGKQVDFLFKIVYKCNNDDTQSRAIANQFFESIRDYLQGTKIDLGEGRTYIRCIQSSGANKTAVNSNNAQEWTAEYTLTYQEY